MYMQIENSRTGENRKTKVAIPRNGLLLLEKKNSFSQNVNDKIKHFV